MLGIRVDVEHPPPPGERIARSPRSPRDRGPPTRSARIRAGPRIYSTVLRVTPPLASPPATARMSRYRSITALQRDLAQLPALPRRRLSDRVRAGRPRSAGPTRLSLRPGARDRRGSGGRTVARTRRPHAAPLARARRGDVLRHLLLRLGDALLSGPHRRRTRRPHADPGRAAPLRAVARGGAAPPPPDARPHGRRPRGPRDHRRQDADGVRRQELRRRRRDRDPAAAPVGRERVARTTPANRARLGKALTHARRELARLDDQTRVRG